jgi:hypothetical protein
MHHLSCLGVILTAGLVASCGTSRAACLDASMFSSFFAINDSKFCAVAIYTAPESLGGQLPESAPTWGSHGGPLIVKPDTKGTGATLERWTAPSGRTGTMTVQRTPIASAYPTGTFLGSQAVDLPFFGWTAISWTKPFPNVSGKFEMIGNGAIVASYDANAPHRVAAVAAASSLGRLLFSGNAPVGTTTAGPSGLYAADACSSPSQGLGTGTGCSASAIVAGWGEATGMMTTDSNGDVFAVMTSTTTRNQEARGFLASSVARGAVATTGVPLFTIDGFSGSLAALSPTATDPGVVVFQPFDVTTEHALDVIEQKFTTVNSLAAIGTPSKMLTVTPAQSLAFVVDRSERLWVAASGNSSTTYVVLARQ